MNGLWNTCLGIILCHSPSVWVVPDFTHLPIPYGSGFPLFIATEPTQSHLGISIHLQVKRSHRMSNGAVFMEPVIPKHASLCNLTSLTLLVSYFTLGHHIVVA
jgi:hypothetical protein